MKFKGNYQTTLFLLSLIQAAIVTARSPHRPVDSLKPEIITRWLDDTQEHHLRSYYLEERSIFTKFDRKHFFEHMLPDGPIEYHSDSSKTVDGSKLKELAEELLQEIRQHKKKFTHFKVLKDRDFNRQTLGGLIIVEFKDPDYPFILKLGMENPASFVSPFTKGWQPCCFFYLASGINRYLSGFTRIKNREALQTLANQDPEWRDLIAFPRKWFWLPKDTRWFEVRGKNLGPTGCPRIELPSVYGIFVDKISKAEKLPMRMRATTSYKKSETSKTVSGMHMCEHRKLAIRFAQYVENRTDAHFDNFIREKDTGKIMVIDTEHFPTMMGFEQKFRYESYTSWYTQLALRCLHKMYCHSKSYRRRKQTHPGPELYPVDLKEPIRLS